MGFDFYIPNPKWKAWKKEDDRLKKQKIAKKHRPAEPQRHPNYPTKVKIALNLLQAFCANFPDIQIKCFLADGLYGSSEFLENASSLFEKKQVITKMKNSQLVRHRNRKILVSKF